MGCAFCGGNEGTLALIPSYGSNLYCTPCRREFYPQGWDTPNDEMAQAEMAAGIEESEVWW